MEQVFDLQNELKETSQRIFDLDKLIREQQALKVRLESQISEALEEGEAVIAKRNGLVKTKLVKQQRLSSQSKRANVLLAKRDQLRIQQNAFVDAIQEIIIDFHCASKEANDHAERALSKTLEEVMIIQRVVNDKALGDKVCAKKETLRGLTLRHEKAIAAEISFLSKRIIKYDAISNKNK